MYSATRRARWGGKIVRTIGIVQARFKIGMMNPISGGSAREARAWIGSGLGNAGDVIRSLIQQAIRALK
jgi:hypothetical protein